MYNDALEEVLAPQKIENSQNRHITRLVVRELDEMSLVGIATFVPSRCYETRAIHEHVPKLSGEHKHDGTREDPRAP